MKRFIRILCIALVVTAVFSLFNVAFADSVNCQYANGKTKGGAVIFTATATGNGTATITFNIGRGSLKCTVLSHPEIVQVYGAIEISIKDSKGNEVYFGNIYNSSSKKVSFKVKKNETYTVKVWNWNPLTTARFYLQNHIIKPGISGFNANNLEKAVWTKLPTIKATTPVLFSKVKIK